MSCGPKSGPNPDFALPQIEVVESKPPTVFASEIPEPGEPEERTVRGLIQHILVQREVITQHNADKAAQK